MTVTGARPRYEIERRIGIGGMAEVFRARETSSGRAIALKRLLGDDVEHLDLFLDEARVAVRLVHPNVVRVHELGCDEHGLYLALELVDGVSLRSILARARRTAPLPRALAVHIVAEVATALAYVHGATDERGAPLGIVHRDVNPANVMISREGDVKLTDFGIAKVRGAVHRTRTGVLRGTCGYMSPEQHQRAPVDAASDVWSAGVVLWEATVGRPLFRDDDDDASDGAARICAGLITPPSVIDRAYPEALEAIVMGALERIPSRRPSAAALASSLRAYLAATGAAPARGELAALVRAWFGDAAPPVEDAEQPTRLERAPRPRPRRRRADRLTLGAIASAIAIGALTLVPAPRTWQPIAPTTIASAAWTEAQRGGFERARPLADELSVARPRDPDAAVLDVLVHWWLGSRQVDQHLDAAEALPQPAARRELLRALRLLQHGRPADAVAVARAAEERHPGSVEIAYALGEALWHAGDRGGGAAWLAIAIRRDPRWQMALPHAIDFWAAHGDAASIRAAADVIASRDREGAAALRVLALISERRYDDACTAARAATAAGADDPRLWRARAQAEVLAGALDDAARSIDVARERWPFDDRDDGPFEVWAELYLYRHDEDDFLRVVGARANAGDVLRRIVWHRQAPATPPPIRTDLEPQPPGNSGMSPPPLFEAMSTLGAFVRGDDPRDFYALSPNPEIRAFGAGLAASRRGDRRAAAAWFAIARDAALGETRPLMAYWLARTLHALGDERGAAAACDEVRRPRWYVTYRAVLLQDCGAWGPLG